MILFRVQYNNIMSLNILFCFIRTVLNNMPYIKQFYILYSVYDTIFLFLILYYYYYYGNNGIIRLVRYLYVNYCFRLDFVNTRIRSVLIIIIIIIHTVLSEKRYYFLLDSNAICHCNLPEYNI